MMVEGEAEIDMAALDPKRYGPWITTEYAARKNEESYSNVFVLHHPDEEREAARPLRTAPCYDRMAARGAQFGQVDVLVNNAGISGGSYPPVTENEKSDWEKILGVNLIGAMLMIKHVAPHMQERQQGAIVNTASVAGIRSGAGGNPYSASKAGVINLTQTAACDLGGYNVRVNAVCPGLIETGMTRKVFEYARSNEKEHKLGSRCELRRYGRPEELAAAICFLASDDASYITGQTIYPDGGRMALNYTVPVKQQDEGKQ